MSLLILLCVTIIPTSFTAFNPLTTTRHANLCLLQNWNQSFRIPPMQTHAVALICVKMREFSCPSLHCDKCPGLNTAMIYDREVTRSRSFLSPEKGQFNLTVSSGSLQNSQSNGFIVSV